MNIYLIYYNGIGLEDVFNWRLHLDAFIVL